MSETATGALLSPSAKRLKSGAKRVEIEWLITSAPRFSPYRPFSPFRKCASWLLDSDSWLLVPSP